MCIAKDPADMAEALAMLESGLGFLAGLDKAGIPCEALGELLRVLERADAVESAVRGEAMAAFDAQDGSVADGQRTMRAWMVNTARVTKGQAAEHRPARPRRPRGPGPGPRRVPGHHHRRRRRAARGPHP